MIYTYFRLHMSSLIFRLHMQTYISIRMKKFIFLGAKIPVVRTERKMYLLFAVHDILMQF